MTKIQKRKIIENKRFDLINDLNLSGTTEVKKIILEMMREGYKKGLMSAKSKKELAIFDPEPALDSSDVAEWLKQASIYTTSETGQQILKVTKGTLLEAIKSGASVKETIKMLEEEYKGWDKVGGAPRIENIVRTNTANAFNQGRLAEFSKMKEVLAGYQYSAILDNRTSPICEQLHGRVFKPAEADAYNPPIHYQCRSVLVPIFVDELEKTGERFNDLPSIHEVPVEKEKGGFLKLAR